VRFRDDGEVIGSAAFEMQVVTLKFFGTSS
jgi:hypothetical protein